jgi:hypothetical protein
MKKRRKEREVEGQGRKLGAQKKELDKKKYG